MHSKDKGSLGQLKVAADLISQGYSVFTELGDNCKTDLVIIDRKSYKTYKVQVKARCSKNGSVSIKTTKSGPNYQFAYEEKHADIYAIYILDKDKIFYVSNSEFLLHHTMMTFRLALSKNGQEKGCNFVEKYYCIKNAIGLVSEKSE